MVQTTAFSDVFLQQAVFRTFLNALSRPGTIGRLPEACLTRPQTMVKAICQALLDHEVAFALAGRPHPDISAENIVHWTHSRQTSVDEADFLMVSGAGCHEEIRRLKRGTPEMPDTGATAIFFMPQLFSGAKSHTDLNISGPGIAPPGHLKLPALGLADKDIAAIEEANAEFPLGIDCLVLDPEGNLLGLPRSVCFKRTA